MRTDRPKDRTRKISITRNFTKYAQGSVLCEFGDTKVLCTAMVEERVPAFLKGSGQGWVTAEYSMLPSANRERKQRDISRLKMDARSTEIQRLIGRSLRAAVDMKALGERTIYIDCDVLQADGGTRVTSITGGFVALYDAVRSLMKDGLIKNDPIKNYVAAVSVGIVDNQFLCDLCYEEDSRAMMDMNVVMTDKGEFVELQATAEGRSATRKEMGLLMDLAEAAISEIIQKQKEALGING